MFKLFIEINKKNNKIETIEAYEPTFGKILNLENKISSEFNNIISSTIYEFNNNNYNIVAKMRIIR